MLGSFWDAVGGKLADRWAAVGAPGLVFWLGGLLAWALGTGGLHRLAVPVRWLDKQTTATQVIALLTALLGVVASVIVVNRLTLPALRVLEGYSQATAPAGPIRVPSPSGEAVTTICATAAAAGAGATGNAASRHRGRVRGMGAARPHAATSPPPAGNGADAAPRLGNTLRAAESWPTRKYGLDAVTVWPRLWLVLPDRASQELVAARASLDGSAAAAVSGTAVLLLRNLDAVGGSARPRGSRRRRHGLGAATSQDFRRLGGGGLRPLPPRALPAAPVAPAE